MKRKISGVKYDGNENGLKNKCIAESNALSSEENLAMPSDESSTEIIENIPAKSKWAIAIADSFCGILGNIIFGGALTYYYSKCLGLNSNYISTVWLIFAFWNAINDPLFGYISDRTKTKIGRRIPYIRYGGIIYGVFYALSFLEYSNSPSQSFLFAQMLITLFLFDTFYTAVASAIYVMPFEIAITNKARKSVIYIKSLLMFLPIAFSVIVIPLVQPDTGDSLTGYKIFNVVLGIVIGLILFGSTYFYKERNIVDNVPKISFLKSLIECLKNKQFLIYEVLNFTIVLVQGFLLLGLYYYLDEFNQNQLTIYISIACGVVCGLIAIPFSLKKMEAPNVLIIICGVMYVTAMVVSFWAYNAIVAAITFFLMGMGFLGLLFVSPILIGDVIDYDELRVGQRREGMYAGVNSFITKPAQSIAQSGFMLMAVNLGYKENLEKGAQSLIGKMAILKAWMIIPACCLLISFIVLFFFNLKGKEWKIKKEELAKLHIDN